MTYATTFSGIGGWEIGLNACGWELKWQCEFEPHKRRFLRDKFAGPVFQRVEHLARCCPPPVDCWACSPPCQPFSLSGQRKGQTDDRHLWPSLFAALQRHHPRYVLIEQVADIDGVVLDEMLSNLESAGYEVLPPLEIPACGVGAWHYRLRVWIVAHDARVEWQPRNLLEAGAIRKPQIESGGVAGVAIPEIWKPTHTWFEREPGLGRLVHGIPNRTYRLSGLGDAVVPQIPYLIGQAINQTEAMKV